MCLEDESINCVYINSTVYSYNNEMPYSEYLDISLEERKPFLKTCDKEQVDDEKCKTDKCKNDSDCFSGLCYSNTCITKSTVYLCSGVTKHDIMSLRCGKQAQMKCESEDECYDNKCQLGFCENYGSDLVAAQAYHDLYYGMIGMIIFIVVFIIVFCIVIRCYLKKEKK